MFHCVEELHKLGIIHRDINPQHFMKQLNTNQIVLIDFGTAIFLPELPESKIAKLNTSDLNETNFCGKFRGSIEFAALEILHSIVKHEQ